MAIFNPILPVPASDVLAAQQTVSAGNALFAMLLNAYKTQYANVWQNRVVTPDKIIAALGTQAVAVFTHAAALAAFINGFGQTQVVTGYPAGWSVAFNQDGSAVASFTVTA